MNDVIASINGESIENSKKKKQLSKLLGLPIRRVRGGKRIRTEVLKSDSSCWDYTKKKKSRQDTLSAEVKKKKKKKKKKRKKSVRILVTTAL